MTEMQKFEELVKLAESAVPRYKFVRQNVELASLMEEFDKLPDTIKIRFSEEQKAKYIADEIDISVCVNLAINYILDREGEFRVFDVYVINTKEEGVFNVFADWENVTEYLEKFEPAVFRDLGEDCFEDAKKAADDY